MVSDNGEGRTTIDAARKRRAAWRDDPEAQKPKDARDRSNEADAVPAQPGRSKPRPEG